jgi:uncharacterized protein YicC (UPF0701 family)
MSVAGKLKIDPEEQPEIAAALTALRGEQTAEERADTLDELEAEIDFAIFETREDGEEELERLQDLVADFFRGVRTADELFIAADCRGRY